MLRVPGDGLVGRQQAVLDLARRDVPRRLRVVEQRGPAPPAMRVGVLVGLGPEQLAPRAEVLDQIGIGVLDADPRVLADPIVEGAVEPDRIDHVQPEPLAELEVVLAERDRGVDQSGAVVGSDEVGGEHRVAELAVRLSRDERERWLVRDSLELGARKRLENLSVLPEHVFDELLGDHEHGVVIAGARPDVGQHRVDGDRGVRDERPRRRRPHHELVPGAHRSPIRAHRQPDVRRGVDDVPVDARLTQLVTRERRLVAGAVRDDLQLLVQQSPLVDCLQRPPDRLDVSRVHRPVGVVEIDPERDPLGQPVPLGDVAEHALAAALVELGDPVTLDVLLAGEAELGLDRELDREPVAVPASLALDVVAAHRLVPREDVLEHSTQDVVRAGRSVRGRRALVEGPLRSALPAADRLGEHVALAPALEHAQLDVGERRVWIDGPVRGRRHGGRL